MRKKKFTEHQLDRSQRREEGDYCNRWEGEDGAGAGGHARDYTRNTEDSYDSHVETLFVTNLRYCYDV